MTAFKKTFTWLSICASFAGLTICALACALKASPDPEAEAFNTDVFFMLLMFNFYLLMNRTMVPGLILKGA
jgi:hypothetical protein